MGKSKKKLKVKNVSKKSSKPSGRFVKAAKSKPSSSKPSGKTKLIAKYLDKGYRDAKITDSKVTKVSEKRLSIQLTIAEGHKYFFRNITWLGNTKHTSQELSSILGIKKGDVYDQSVLEERLFMSQSSRDVSSLYMDDGYLFFQVTPVEINVENDSIDLEMRSQQKVTEPSDGDGHHHGGHDLGRHASPQRGGVISDQPQARRA